MIDFLEYVVSELKSKRLSKANAADLVRQFSRRSSGTAAAIHPLLHRNTSDLHEQRYSSTFTGREFFLADHQVRPAGGDSQKVLPAVAYLEMARAAVEQALAENGAIELHNTVWAQPVVVSEAKEVSIALIATGDDEADYEIYSQDGEAEFVHAQGHAVLVRDAAATKLDLDQLRNQMSQDALSAESVYATCTRMGLLYGPAFQSITAIHRGDGQLLAELRRPATADESADLVLHPSLMDGALQAAVGLLDTDSNEPRLPFALDTLRVLAPCTGSMVAWLRYAAGSRPTDKVVKLDIDLCDTNGNVCVQLRGFSWRVLASDLGVTATQRRAVGTLFAAPVWEASELVRREVEFAEQHVISIQAAAGKTIAAHYTEQAVECFERIQAILGRKPQGKVLVQVVVTDDGEQALLAGLSGLLRTAALENPQFVGQVILVPADMSADEWLRRVEEEKTGSQEPVVRYRNGAREVLRFQEVAADASPAALKDNGVYLITGGFGGLGTLFANAILDSTRNARVIVTGRAETRAPWRDGITYRQVDLADADQVARLIAGIRKEFGRLDGILHTAGMIADGFIVKKDSDAFRAVLEPKVTGTFNLDQATKDLDLDFFVLFSALAAALGNVGQADYAAANAFMDCFAAFRQGRIRSINWPLWQDGGMSPDAASIERLQKTTGMQPMLSATGVEAFHRVLALPYEQVIVVEGEVAQLRRSVILSREDGEGPSAVQPTEKVLRFAQDDTGSLAEKTQQYLRKEFSEILKVPAARIDVRAALENYGIDSIIAMKLTNQLELTFGTLPKTLFFEYQTIRELADYFLANFAAQLAALLAPSTQVVEAAPKVATPAPAAATVVSNRRARSRRNADRRPTQTTADEPIAIVGLSGRYPEAVNLEKYWQNLRDGKDCITEVPKDRWDWREYFSEDRTKAGHHYSKWGGFIEGVDEFDPLFFNISPVDAEAIDPQERLFLQHCWMAIEDAGYTRASLQIPHENDLPGQVGVYVGVMYTEYQLFGAEAIARGKRLGVPGSAASISNRVSYALNLHGPSMTVDTMCSSSLTAIHVACEDLRHGRTSLALAGGVNVSIHPNKYLVLSDGQFISSDGHCQSFGEGGDGYIPGEGVGVVVLKRLSDAKRDGDHIYGVIRGSALTHGGKTNGYSVPNPQAQASAITRALVESNTDARHISYLEAHGTGTKLGDPIEIAALAKSFQKYTQDTGYCLIGSAKSNIGHCESAAGIAGLTKILLQLQHKQIVPSLHSAQLNPHIDFARTPFVVNQELTPWEAPVVDGRTLPRIAGISSFGAGGSNAHLIIEEYAAPTGVILSRANGEGPSAIVLSARTAAQLTQKAQDLLDHLRVNDIDLAAVAYTLQTGREAMDERLAFIVRSSEELVEKLEGFLSGKQLDETYRGAVKRNNETLALFADDADLQQAVERWVVARKLPKLLELWTKGLELDWNKFYGEATPRRVSLPVYPFARDKYWIDTASIVPVKSGATAVLHPLLHANTSDLSEQRYSSTFDGNEFFLADHQVNVGGATAKVLPGVAYLEMARAAIERAAQSKVVELRDTVWAQPVVVRDKSQVSIVLLPGDGAEIEYEIFSGDDTVNCQGRAILGDSAAVAKLDLAQLRARMAQTRDAAGVYEACTRLGLLYGPSFRAITAMHRGADEVLAELRLPVNVAAGAADYVLHPSLLDGALQAAVGLLEDDASNARLPFALETLRVAAPCTAEMFAWVRFSPGSTAADAVVKLDVDLIDADGNVCVQMHGFSARALAHGTIHETAAGTLIAAPVWQASELPAIEQQYAGHHLLTLRAEANETVAERYSRHALECFETIQSILRNKPQGKVLLQVVANDDLSAGLAALLKTAAQENPQFVGQLIIGGEEHLDAEKHRGTDALVRYERGVRQIVRWEELAADSAPVAFKDGGVYLITGGFGGLGTLFANEILDSTRDARVIVTGRAADRTPWRERITYRQVDLADAGQVAQLITECGRLDGILHCAGMTSDSLIVSKTTEQFRDVLAPKVLGTFNLDQATKDLSLDFFVLFSSLAGAAGNAGQADYAAANGFMDRYAALRSGRIRSINWPLWQDGGMTVDSERQELLRRTTGMQPMQTATGMAAFRRALATSHDQVLVVEGDLARLRRSVILSREDDRVILSRADGEGPSRVNETEQVLRCAQDDTVEYLRKALASVLKLSSHQIDPQAALEEYGIDSILAMKLTAQLEKTFGALPKTLFFEYQTIAALAGYFAENHAAQLATLFAPEAVTPQVISATPAPAQAKLSTRRFKRASSNAKSIDEDPIAIIGLSGRYPQSVDVEAYWNNLREGKDCISEVPKDRWDWREYFSEDRGRTGHHFSKWGGFIEGVDEFDPLFFNISPVDAEALDPQERLFLQHAWSAMEDAGYTRAALQVKHENDLAGQVGVYVGVMWSEYQLFAGEANARGKRLPIPGSTASIANRVSYVLNLHGPSVTLDTMCSSSLTAIHFACQDLKLGRTNLAIAGGVNVTIHPNKYLVLSAGQFISSDGHCQSFGEGGDGYIPGEGVGAVVLKRLSEAKRDGDHVYGIIRGSALNHGGKTNGYTVPNPQAQASAIARALAESHTDARHISYIEAHGTGTTLGDPIEIAALSKAFGKYTEETGYCLIGSAKSNIGHCESAAGIAGLTKVLLQLQHKQIVPSLHSAKLNPHIDFGRSPFVVNQELKPWEAPVVDGRTLPRIAGISSFGAGGSNAHLIIEEYQQPAGAILSRADGEGSSSKPRVILLSARTPEQLRQKASDLVAFVRSRSIDLTSLAYTLQVGREPMEERLGLVVNSIDELVAKLESWLSGEQGIEDAYQGQVKRNSDGLSAFSTDDDLRQTVDKWIAAGKVARLLDLWAKGLDLDWSKLYGDAKPRRISVPAYPFARERYWIDTTAFAPVKGATTAVLHPLLHSNTSDLSEQRYRSTFTGDEFFLADHQVQVDGVIAGKVLPGVAYLEMARAAIEQALPEQPESTVLELRNVVWAQPIVVGEPRQVSIALSASDDEQIDFEIFSDDVVHGQGQAVVSREAAPARVDLAQLESRMTRGPLASNDVYAAFGRMGLHYGHAMQGVTALHRGEAQALAQLRLPEVAASAEYVLHPSVMDGALQAAVGLLDDAAAQNEPRLPFALDSLRILAPCTASMFAWVRLSAGSNLADNVFKLDIDLCDERGNVCVAMRGLSLRALERKAAGALVATPVWQASAVETFAAMEFAERHVIVCELPRVDVEQLAALLPLSECLSLEAPETADLAERYTEHAIDCFERVQSIFTEQREGKVLVQIAIADDREHLLFAGLSGLLETAALESPQFIGQVVVVPAESSAEDLERYLNREQSRGLDVLVKYNGVRRVLRWQEVPVEHNAPVAFKKDGVYLITGGVGGLGLLFAREIAERGAKAVLTGRSPLTAEKQALIGDAAYHQLDLTSLANVEGVIAAVRTEHGRLDGVLHSAGMTADRLIPNKTAAEFAQVLAPKVTGTLNLDRATRGLELDFLVLFSSVAGVTGNPGQADYATANGFMDQFAAWRNAQVGRTLSINWPLWRDGGMKVDRATEELLQRTTGMSAMQTETGMAAFHRAIASSHSQLLVVEGDVARIRRALLAEPGVVLSREGGAGSSPEKVLRSAQDDTGLIGKTQDYLRAELSELLKLPVQKIDPQAALEKYGIDSILAMRLTSQLEKTFGSLSKTLFFEFQTIAALAGYFVKSHADVLRAKVGLGEQPTETVDEKQIETAVEQRPVANVVAPVRRNRARFLGAKAAEARNDIAIVGLSGRYPQAENLMELWQNLKAGRDSITEIPAERWDHSLYFDADPNKAGKSYSKWGGFIADVDKFDPLFFSISPKEAEMIDPQERLFLETAWETIEDAGYTRAALAGTRTGVFVGVMWGHYELFGADVRGNSMLPGASHASIANRVSYFFDFHGPSIALDTMCSSSLTAIHLACEALRRGEIDAAIAGGVNVSIHPYKYLTLSQGKFAASDGRCRSFGAGGDGYVPGEGVGAILLKPLDAALRDGDQIYAVLKSTSVNHGGKTNGYTVPNPNAQGDLVRDALTKANIDPQTLGYIETHGTGTSLGDPIEITGLLKAFEGSGEAKQIVPIGSVKSNIGHLESAAGIAAVTKALLQLRHKQLVPSLHAEPLNPNIDFESTPFYVQRELAEWVKPASHPRRAGISSFGAGGSNAHLILEEYSDAVERGSRTNGPEAFVLSAKSAEALRRYARRMVRFLDDATSVSLADAAYTSQIGRTAMDVRLAIVAANTDELRAKLNAWLSDESELSGVFSGNVREAQFADALIAGAAGKAFVEALLRSRDLEKIAHLWVLGADVDWSLLERRDARRVSLPTYPFEKERYWVKSEAPAVRVTPSTVTSPAQEARSRNHYVPTWMAKSIASATRNAGRILLLDSSDALFNAMSDDSIVLVTPGPSFEEIAPNHFALDFASEEQAQAFVAELATKNLLPEVVLHHAAEAGDDDVARQLDRGVFALFNLCRSLRNEVRILSVFTGTALNAAIGGFLKTVTLENPSQRTKSVELAGELTIDEKAALIRLELSDADWNAQEIRYQNGARFERTLVPHTVSQGNLPLRRNGVYVITGGVGGLGLIFAEYLAKNYEARLVLVGRSVPNAAQQEKLAALGTEVLVLQGDVARLADVENVVREAKARFGEIHGVIHSAGVTRDALIVRKTREEMDAVLAPKVFGTINLDLATRNENLDFFALFSSVAGVTGNPGQCDYAFGNHFLDSFAERRAGRTLSINWPLWEEGGMTISREAVARMEQQTGLAPLPTADGIAYFEELLRSGASQGVPLYGIASRIAGSIGGQVAQPRPVEKPKAIDAAALTSQTETYLKEVIGEEIKLAAERIASTEPLESFGLDSVMITRINARLERDLGELPKTLLYEHETVRDITAYLVRESRQALASFFGTVEEPVVEVIAPVVEATPVRITAGRDRDELEPIAIIGMDGYYPQSATLDEYWSNLRDGKDLTGLVPTNRWDAEALYDEDPAAAADGRIYCKWGGFVADHDKFDPHFFKISTSEAKVIDPQERLFLQSVWGAIEDAGYTRDSLRASYPKAGSADVGVFVGVTTNTYQLWAPEERNRGNFVSPTSMPWSIANRVSYFFDFNGPSLPVDTACSSSLVAIHLACESLRNRDCRMAIAGGVNLYLHPAKYQSLCQKRMLSTDGKCHSYGAGDDGFVPGEGVGTVVLKPLSQAIADGDRVYAVIRSSAYDHSGRSNGYSAPNPNAQAALIGRTLERAHVSPETIGYVEGHGTGTQLGDSIEIAALTKAFETATDRKQFVPLGCVKANIGHSEAAAGISGLAKVVLQMQHGQLVPSIHSDEQNPNIEFETSPFYLQHGLSDWQRANGQPRRALINSFGAGGLNACLLVEEYDQAREASQFAGPFLFTLSAKNEERLRDYADRFLTLLRGDRQIELSSLCYTLQTGREAMEERLAVVVSTVDQLIERLDAFSHRAPNADIHRGSLGPRRAKRSHELVAPAISEHGLDIAASRWVSGEEIDWASLYVAARPRRIALPTYPFARERYWVSDAIVERPAASRAQLHPLVTNNSSTLDEVRFTSILPENDFYALDHKVHGEAIFPGAAFVEMACISANLASEQRVRKIKDIVWMQPLSFRGGAQTLRTTLRRGTDGAEYVISSFDEEHEQVVHSEGRLLFGNGVLAAADADRTTPQALKAQCGPAESGAAHYDKFRSFGLQYGPAFQTIQEVYTSDAFAMARLKLADEQQAEFGQYILHPSILDGALQTIATLAAAHSPKAAYVPFALDEIELLRPLPQTCWAVAERADAHAQTHSGVTKFNIRLISESGEVLVRLKNLYVRPLAVPVSDDEQTETRSRIAAC